ncbi:amidase [Conexibacter sp. JD483]|uniref:amidase n=1 Tax=unclassified Conexibacter TaxID=2627773 RepID=UPI00271BD0EE|nr:MULTISPECIES: amidase [unclassified Conexibacter]MDO8188589.1 amidase [Conexibacter sp. CPCC 205706]MDO8201464.1 amidase [Conexibacter sp. CPCC 205762]MDR9372098.1 amidase [Conexibacter sp. JD483]
MSAAADSTRRLLPPQAPPTAGELLARFAAREQSPVEVARETLARIAATDGELHAFSFLDEEAVLAAARTSERRWATGEPRGLLEGVPVAVKDVDPQADAPNRLGFQADDERAHPQEDGSVVAALRRHGAVLSGRTTVPQLGWKGVTDGPGRAPTRNPHDLSRTAGGSSGGSAAAVAAGCLPLATGTDGGGSVRIPAACCGLVGIKPTFGRVAQWPPSGVGMLGHTGPIARTVADAALLLDVLAERDPREAASLPALPRPYREQLGGGVAGLRIAVSTTLGFADGVAPEAIAPLLEAAAALGELGAHVEQVDPPLGDPRELFARLWETSMAAIAADLPAAWNEELQDGLRATIERGRERDAVALARAELERMRLGAAMGLFHEQWDLLLTPALAVPPFAAGQDMPGGWPAAAGWPAWTPFTWPFNLTQQPALTLPWGATADGLPLGLQLVGARHDEPVVLRAAAALEESRRGVR